MVQPDVPFNEDSHRYVIVPVPDPLVTDVSKAGAVSTQIVWLLPILPAVTALFTVITTDAETASQAVPDVAMVTRR